MEVIRYSVENFLAWNEFIQNSKNGTFMHKRTFMDYHSDRFNDYSLLVLNDKGIICAVLPANINNGVLHSHQGLTYGGFIVRKNETTPNTLRYFQAILQYLQNEGIEELVLKQLPDFYANPSHQEIDYACFLVDAQSFRVDIAFAINQREERIPFQERRRRAIKKAIKLGVEIVENTDFAPFWNEILTPNLQKRFGVNPVHSLNEIEKLATDNSGVIRQFEARLDGAILAGTTVFESETVAHAQYISASDEGRNNGAIDFLFGHLIEETFKNKNYFDFGIVNENQGRKINNGLLEWKEGFGAKAYTHRFYSIQTKNYQQIQNALA